MSPDEMTDVTEMVDFACGIAREAGGVLMSMLPMGRWRGEVQEKESRELVSRADRTSEALLVRRMQERFPAHGIVAEEGGGSVNGEAAYVWHIDPLDGTTNFLHGHPMFCVSLGARELATGEMVAGVVYVPYLNEMFFAGRGQGSFLNSRSIRLEVSSTDDLSDALVATGFAYDRDRYRNYDNFLTMAKAARGVRRCGAAAIDLAYVAAGRYDAFWELGLSSYDVAAGALLITEAGGRVADFDGGDTWLDGGNIIASNARLFDEVRELVRMS